MQTIAILESSDIMGSPDTPIYQVFSLSEITSTSPLSNGDDGATVTYEPPSDPIAPTPTIDTLEANLNFVKAEESFFVTPHSKYYEETVQGTLNEIGASCASDFALKCTVTSSEEAYQETLDTLRRKVLTKMMEGRVVNEANLRGSRRLTSHRDERNHQDNHEDRHHGGRGDGNPSDPHDGSDNDNESEDGHDGDHDQDGHHHGGDDHHHDHDRDHRRHRHDRDRSDELFMGSLGYGSIGDTCLYQNFEQLAPSCQSSIADLHMLRSQYWEEEMRMDDMSRDNGFEVYHIAIVLMYFFVALYAYRKASATRKINNTIFATIMANPALKQQGEYLSSLCR